MKRKTIQQSIKRRHGLPIVELKPQDYQPTKAELEADATIDTTPERLADYVLRQVAVRRKV